MPRLLDELRDLRFHKRGTIKLGKGKPHPTFNFEHDYNKDGEGMVYMWIVEENGEPINIIYIGKTKKALFDRCTQHESGFRNSKRGKELSKELLKVLSGQKTISLYGRRSTKRTMFGFKVSLCDAEEEALIKKFYNSHKLMNIIGKDGKLGFVEAMQLAVEYLDDPSGPNKSANSSPKANKWGKRKIIGSPDAAALEYFQSAVSRS